MLAIYILKDFQVRRVVIHGDFEMVIKQMLGEYQDRHPRTRSYRNDIQNLIKCFEECNFNLIPRLQNCIANSWATSATIFKIPIHPNRKYEVEVRHKPYVPDNVKSWQVFEDDKQIQNFLTLTRDFDGLTIDENNVLLEGSTLTQESLQSQIVIPKEMPRDDIVVPIECVNGTKYEEVIGPESQGLMGRSNI